MNSLAQRRAPQSSSPERLDRLDIRILNAIQHDSHASAEALAETIPLSPSAILRRIRRYRESGLVTADVAIIDPSFLGDRISVLVMAQLENHSLRAVHDLIRAVAEVPEIQMCMQITGKFDLAMLGIFTGISELNDFSDRVLAPSPAVRRYETSLVRRWAKSSTAVPLRLDCIGPPEGGS